MKKILLPILAMVLAIGISVPVAAHHVDDPYVTQLIAGQDTDVGEVKVWNDGDNLYVQYVVSEEGWYLTETHLHIADSVEGIPQKNGNPPPGQFDYSAYYDLADKVIEDTYTISMEDLGNPACDAELFIAAHAVVQKVDQDCPAIMYGTSLGSTTAAERIYEIDVSTLTAIELFDTNLNSSSINGPNGNAYDPVNNRLYYSDYNQSNTLYFYDFTNAVNNNAGTITSGSSVACAGWYSGGYYYIPQNSNTLYKTSFNPDGTVSGTAALHTFGSSFGSFGDVVITSGGLLYGSSGIGFWSIDLLAGYTYTLINGSLPHMQLAFGSDGTLYGHDAGNGNFYTIEAGAGTRTVIGAVDSLTFTDLACGPYEPCVPQEETAWGDGEDFPGKNWAMYFTYNVQCEIPQVWPEGGTLSVAFEDLAISGGNDWDYNDFVADIDTLATFFGTPSDKDLVQMDFTIRPEAKIAGYTHVMHLDNDSFTSDGTYELYRDVALVDSGVYDASTGLDVILVPNTGSLPNEVVLIIKLDTPCDFSFPIWDTSKYHGENLFFDPYIVVNNTGEEIHTGDPRMLTVPVDWVWPTPDGNAIWNVYPKVTAGVPPNPPIFVPDWWTP